VSQQKIIFVQQFEEGKVSDNDGVGIAWEMRPYFFVIRFHHYLIDGLLHNYVLQEGGDGEDEYKTDKETGKTAS
jgi:hypothetical protein